MSPSRYEQINTLLDQLLETPVHEREAVLEQSCPGDEDLKATIEGLLKAYESTDGFLDAPAVALLIRDQHAHQERVDLTGAMIGGYQILRPLGAGALAEVWLARDKRLPRRVALKILRSNLVRDPNQILRFQQEAHAASALSHPNIVTIYEIGESEGFHFIAQEFVDGVTLRNRLGNQAMPLDEVLAIAKQVLAALSTAHNSGIIHRDIKPENLMIRPDGLVKVLDFGIARIVPESLSDENGWRGAEGNLTSPGLILGTVRYMSPEQARGLTLDHRSDIFSFGAVLYEMATGRTPFSGVTSADILAALLMDEPPPLSNYRRDLPGDFEQVVLRCLKKDRNERFSSAEDLSRALVGAVTGGMERGNAPVAVSSRGATAAVSARKSSGQDSRTRRLVWALCALIALISVGLLIRRAMQHSGNLPFDSLQMSRLTLPGPVTDAAISPSGSGVVYLSQTIDGPSIWVRQLAPVLDRRVGVLKPGNYQDLIYSPDGRFVYFVQMTNLAHVLYRMPAAGGRPDKILDNVTGRISFAPDGSRFAFIRLDVDLWQQSLVVANSDGTRERSVLTRRRPNYFSRFGVAWSSDGTSVFCLAGNEPYYTSNAYHLVQVNLADATERPVKGRTWAQVGSLIGSLDGRVLIVGGSEHSENEMQLWRVSYPNGKVTRITTDLSNYAKLSLTGDAKTLLAIRHEKNQDLWLMPLNNSGPARQVSSGDLPELNSATWTSDGRIIYSGSTGQFLNLWKMNVSRQTLDQLTRVDADQTEVATTPDGRYILYHSGPAIWRMNADGSDPRRLTTGNLDVHPTASPDSRWVVYASFQGWSPGIGGRSMIWRVPIDGGSPFQITQDITSIPTVSPDGKLIACTYFGFDKPQSPTKVGVYPFKGGKALAVFDRPEGSDDNVYWSADGTGIEYIVSEGGVSNVWRQPLQGGKPAPITNFRTNRIFFLSPSPDGKYLLMARGKELTELVRIESTDRSY
jgi:serine/threonine protein kinase/Tol biopolymer transport system component